MGLSMGTARPSSAMRATSSVLTAWPMAWRTRTSVMRLTFRPRYMPPVDGIWTWGYLPSRIIRRASRAGAPGKMSTSPRSKAMVRVASSGMMRRMSWSKWGAPRFL